ncbi:MAG: hypothetical protein R3D31_01695 [Hyphomicrobiaceae bacterium]
MSESTDLIDYYRETHARRVYGTSSVKYVRYLRPWIRLLAPRSILDYGCGQSLFIDMLNLGPAVALHRYDPAIPAFATLPPEPADLLVNIDVLEHIPEVSLDPVLNEMRTAARNAILVIDTVPAKHTLPDGRNAHVNVKSPEWWRQKLTSVFGPVEPIQTRRKTRAAFKTWPTTPAEQRAYRRMRLAEDAAYYARRLVGRHKSSWKVSSVKPRTTSS